LPKTAFFSNSVSDANGNFSASLHTDTAGKQMINLTSPVTASLPVDVHPNATSINPYGGYTSQSKSVTITGSGFASNINSPRPTATVAGAAVSNVVVSSDGTSLTCTVPPGPKAELAPVVVSVDGVQSVSLNYNYCPPVTSCALNTAC